MRAAANPGLCYPATSGMDLAHLHGLARRQLLNADDDLVIRCAGRVLEQFPKTL